MPGHTELGWWVYHLLYGNHGSLDQSTDEAEADLTSYLYAWFTTWINFCISGTFINPILNLSGNGKEIRSWHNNPSLKKQVIQVYFQILISGWFTWLLNFRFHGFVITSDQVFSTKSYKVGPKKPVANGDINGPFFPWPKINGWLCGYFHPTYS